MRQNNHDYGWNNAMANRFLSIQSFLLSTLGSFLYLLPFPLCLVLPFPWLNWFEFSRALNFKSKPSPEPRWLVKHKALLRWGLPLRKQSIHPLLTSNKNISVALIIYVSANLLLLRLEFSLNNYSIKFSSFTSNI